MARAYNTDPPAVGSVGLHAPEEDAGPAPQAEIATADGPVSPDLRQARSSWPELEALIGPGGALGRALEGYERRAGQELMMRAVASTLERGGSLVIEAGTGIGKSLGYLVPAALSGQRVILSTGTRTLQDQLWGRQVPFVRDALGIPIEATVLKGRTNYLCLLLLERARDNPAVALDEFADLERIRAWSETTAHGDRAELAALPDGSTAWRAVAADAEQCLGRSCPHFSDCFLMAARRRAEAADIVIVNHHLFFADLQLREGASFSLLPEAHAVVFDEAHHLENVAAMAFGRSVSDARLRRLAMDFRRGFREAGRELSLLDAPLSELDRDRDRLFAHLVGHAERVGRARLVPERLPSSFREAWYKLDNTLIGLGLLASAQARADEAVQRLSARVGELRDDLASLIGPEERSEAGDEEVRWVERGARALFVRSAPVHVGHRLAETLFPRFRSTIFTSATLATHGQAGFAHFRDRLGLPPETHELQLPSPFDYATQALLYVPRDLPDPRHPSFASRAHATIETLVRLTRGRALLLFTSRERMHEAHAALSGRWDHPTFVQGQGSREALLARFHDEDGAVLFATATFWEGVDIVGDALSLVVIDKLPFLAPGDPLVDARVARLAADGRNAFMDYQVPSAILALKQGVGRLIRHRGDRGIIAILDPRLETARYGAAFIASLPPARRTSDLEQLAGWYRTLESPESQGDH